MLNRLRKGPRWGSDKRQGRLDSTALLESSSAGQREGLQPKGTNSPFVVPVGATTVGLFASSDVVASIALNTSASQQPTDVQPP